MPFLVLLNWHIPCAKWPPGSQVPFALQYNPFCPREAGVDGGRKILIKNISKVSSSLTSKKRGEKQIAPAKNIKSTRISHMKRSLWIELTIRIRSHLRLGGCKMQRKTGKPSRWLFLIHDAAMTLQKIHQWSVPARIHGRI